MNKATPAPAEDSAPSHESYSEAFYASGLAVRGLREQLAGARNPYVRDKLVAKLKFARERTRNANFCRSPQGRKLLGTED